MNTLIYIVCFSCVVVYDATILNPADYDDGVPYFHKGAFSHSKDTTPGGSDDTPSHSAYGYIKEGDQYLRRGRDFDDSGNRIKRQGSTDEKFYISDNNSGKFWDPR